MPLSDSPLKNAVISTATGSVFAGSSKFRNAVSKFFGGGRESASDLRKQDIQDKLDEMGYSYFSKMEGWGGDEGQKAEAMASILNAVNQYPGSARRIRSWLNSKGKITPDTIRRVEREYPPIDQSTINEAVQQAKEAQKRKQAKQTSTPNEVQYTTTSTPSQDKPKEQVSSAGFKFDLNNPNVLIGGVLLALAAGGIFYSQMNNEE